MKGLLSAVCRYLGLLRVVGCPEPIDDDYGLVTDNPRVVTSWQRGDIPRAGDELGTVVHPDPELA